MGKVKPRWKPYYHSAGMKFLSYANDLDVWLSAYKNRLFVVGPEEKRITPSSEFNYDAFDIKDGALVMLAERVDLHIDVHDMCLIYALCAKHGVFKENENV